MPVLAWNGAPQSQVQSDWDRYTVSDKDFSVLLPVAPAMSSYKERAPAFSKIVIRNVIGAYSLGVVYAIQIFERKQSLEDFISEFPPYAGEFKRELKVSGISGKEYIFQNDSMKLATQYFITKQYIYVFKAQGSYLGNPDVGMTRFFDSIKFEPGPTGLAIVDGPGAQPSPEPANTNTNGETRVFPGKEVTGKTVVVSKPEPSYTEDARRNQVTGTVVLRCVFSSSGAVTNLKAVSGLPFGLTEQAIDAARQIKFIPAIKDGHFVSMYIQLEYNFNLY
jgi:TonB family protein